MPKEKNIQQTEPVVYQIICPFCFRKFGHEAVHFRASSMKHYSINPQTNDRNQVESAVTDTNLSDFYKQFGRRAPLKNPVIDPSGKETGQEYIRLSSESNAVSYKDGVLYSIKDEFGNESENRLCPYCHNELPRSAGYNRSYTISFAGDTAVGKTVFMTTLINRLDHLGEAFKSVLMPLTKQVQELYEKNYYSPMYEQGILPEHTSTNDVIEPLIYEFRVGIHKEGDGRNVATKTITLTFYDIAGEGQNNPDYIQTRGRQLKNADAFLYMVDPMQTGAAERIMAGNENASGDYIEGRQDARRILESFFLNGIDFADKPTAIVLTKSDLLKTTEGNVMYFEENSNIYRQCDYSEYIRMPEIDGVDQEVQGFFRRASPTFLTKVGFLFNNPKFFAVSALGGPTETVTEGNRQIKRIVNGRPQELRVEEPFLWLLAQLQIIPDSEPIRTTEKRSFWPFRKNKQ